MTGRFKALLASAVVATGIAFGAAQAEATTVTNLPNIVNGQNLDIGDLNLSLDDEFIFNASVNGTGSFAVHTYVDPFRSGGASTANLLIHSSGATSVFAQWGSGPVLALSFAAGTWFGQLSTLFTGTGPGNSEEFKIWWTGASNDQLSVSLSAVPVPPAALLLLTGIGGLGALARRRKQAEKA